MPATERELADDAQWKLIQKNTFTRWTNEHLKTVNKSLTDLEKDLSDGVRLVALVEVLSGKKFPEKFSKRPTFRTQKLENVTMCLKFLQEVEGIKIVNIDSSDIVDHKLKLILGLIWTLILHYSISIPSWEGDDEISVRTRTEQTPKQRLLHWIQTRIPVRPITNFTTDWNDGTAIGALVDAIAPGLCPDWSDWNRSNNVVNATEALRAAEQWLDIPQLIRPDEMCNPKVDELSMMTYLSQFPSAKLKPGAPLRPKTNPARCRAYGPGLEIHGNTVGSPIQFTVETFSAGRGDLHVMIINPQGLKEPCELKSNKDRNASYSCLYTPAVPGKHLVYVKFADRDIPKSPFQVLVEDVAVNVDRVTVLGPGLDRAGVTVNRKTYFDVSTKKAGVGVVNTVVVDPAGRKDTVLPLVSQKGAETWRVEYTPVTEGSHSVHIQYAGKPIPGTPFTVPVTSVVDASNKCFATGRGVQPKGLRVGDEGVFKVHTVGGPEKDISVTLTGPDGADELIRVRKLDSSTSEYSYSPRRPGAYVIQVTSGSQPIAKSPFKVSVLPAKETRIRAYGPGLEKGIAGYPACFSVDTNGETGALAFSIEGPSEARIDCRDIGEGSADITYWPTAPGEYAVHIVCGNEDIPRSPYMADIKPMTIDFGPMKVTATGPGLQRTGVAVNSAAEFVVDTRRCGRAALHITAMEANYSPVDVQIKDNKDGTYLCRYTPRRIVRHIILISYGDVAVPGSPFRVLVQEASNPVRVKVFGPAIERPVKISTKTSFTVDCSQAGPGDVSIALTDEQGKDVAVNTTDNQDNTFTIEFKPTFTGTYLANVFFADQEIPSSPFKVKIESDVDVSKVTVQGLEDKVYLESPAEFTVDARSAFSRGQTKLRGFLISPTGSRSEVTVDKTNDGIYKCTYVPHEQGPHKIELSYDGLLIPKSPFNVAVIAGCDPTRVKAFGPGLEGGRTGVKAMFTVETGGAGQGGLTLGVEGPSEAKINCSDNHDGTCTVEYLPIKAGIYDIGVKFADKHIPGSPFHVPVVDEVNEQRVRCNGPGLDPKGVRRGQPAVFAVDATRAGVAPLEINTVDQKGHKKPAQISPRGGGMFDVVYKPELEGTCQINVTYGGKQVPGSPYKIRVLPRYESNKVLVTGEGVKPVGVLASLPVSFVIDTRDAGFADLDVIIKDPEGNFVRPRVLDTGDGTYTVTYVPTDIGRYTIEVKYSGQDVPSSPFYVVVASTGYTDKVRLLDEIRSTIPVGEPSAIRMDTRRAGHGQVTCQVRSPSDGDVSIDIVDNGDDTVTLIYTPPVVGDYVLDIKYGGQRVPAGLFTQKAVDGVMLDRYDKEQIQETTGDELMTKLARGEELYAPSDSILLTSPPPIPNGHPPLEDDIYRPVDFLLPIGPIFSFVSAIVRTPSGSRHSPRIEDRRNGSVQIRYKPTEEGLHELDVLYNEIPIHGSPFYFYVNPMDADHVTAYGPGLSYGLTGQHCHFTIITNNARTGGLALAVEGPSKAEIKQCVDNNDGTCSVTYVPAVPGVYNVVVKFAEQHIAGSPFTAKILPVSSGDEDEKKIQLSVGVSGDVSLNVTDPDLSSLTASIRTPSGYEEPCTLKKLHNGHLGLTFNPREVGDYLVSVFRRGRHIPNSPFTLTVGQTDIGNASKVKVYGKGLSHGTTNQLNEFFINTQDSGYGGLSLSIEGPSKADIDCRDEQDGACHVTYQPTEPGNYIIHIKFADEHVSGSPFMVKVEGVPSMTTERILRKNRTPEITHLGSVCELRLKIPGTSRCDMEASVTSPSGKIQPCDVTDIDDGKYAIKFVPKETGKHLVTVKHKGIPIPGNPFQFTVGPITDGGAHKVRASGPGLEGGEVNRPNHFSVYTREAGAGGLSIAVEGPSRAEVDFQDRKDGSCEVAYTCTEPGDYLVAIKFNDQFIPGAPFKVSLAPASNNIRKLAFNDPHEHRTLEINKPAAFVLDLDGPFEGQLDALVIAPSGAEDQAIVQLDREQWTVRFIPREKGVHLVHVRHSGNPLPKSPFRVDINQAEDVDVRLVKAFGDGLSHGQTGQLCRFVVNTERAGSGALSVTVDGPSKVQLSCRETELGSEFTYTPTSPGEYLVIVKYAGNNHIPSSPFRVEIEGPGRPMMLSELSPVIEKITKTSTTQSFTAATPAHSSDSSKVTSSGSGLRQAVINKEATFHVDTANAGIGMLMVGVLGPTQPCEEVQVKHIGHSLYVVSYVAHGPGQHTVIVKWADQHVPGSPFNVLIQ